jgi:hypothetical protein
LPQAARQQRRDIDLFALDEFTVRPHTGLQHLEASVDQSTRAVISAVPELADVAVAAEADYFIGNLGNNPRAELLNIMQRMRGDAGRDFHSIDEGSSFTAF